MTITEAIKSKLGTLEVSDDLIEATIIDSGFYVDGSGTYTSDDTKNVDLILLSIYEYLLASPEYKEGSFAYKSFSSAIRLAMSSLKSKYGIRNKNSGGTISARSIM